MSLWLASMDFSAFAYGFGPACTLHRFMLAEIPQDAQTGMHCNESIGAHIDSYRDRPDWLDH